MPVDLVVRNATLPDGRAGMAIVCDRGKIAGIAAGPGPEARQAIDAKGRLVSPPFVDPHFHLDTSLSLGKPRYNEPGTLMEAIKKSRPASAKGIFIKRVTLTSTMAPGVRVDPNAAQAM